MINIRIPARNTGSNGKSGNPWLFLSLLKLISLGEVVVDDKVLSSDLTLFLDGPSDSDVDLSCSLRLSDADVGPCLLLLGLLRLRYWRRLIRRLSLDRPVTDNLAGSGTFGRSEGQAPDGGDAGEAIFDRLKRSYGRFPVEYANALGKDSIEASKVGVGCGLIYRSVLKYIVEQA